MANIGRAVIGAPPPELDAPSCGQGAVDRALRAVTRRARLQAALDTAVIACIASLALFAAFLALRKFVHIEATPLRDIAWALPALGAILGTLRRVSGLHIAQRIDRALETPDLIASAWSFSQVPETQRTPFMQGCLQRAEREAPRTSPAHALPLQAPRSLRIVVLLAMAVCALALFDVQEPRPTALSAVHKPRLIHEDDLDAFRESLAPALHTADGDPANEQVGIELNRLIEALKDRELALPEALKELRALQQRLHEQAQRDDDAALRDALQALGEELKQDTLTKSVADALREPDATKAAAALSKLAQDLRTQPPSVQSQRSLARALERAANAKHDSLDRLAQARKEMERLLKQKAEAKTPDERRERLLKQKQRELDKLERETAPRDQAQRKLDSLQRDLSSASQSLQDRRNDDAAQALDRAAQEANKAAQQQLSAQRRKELQERVQQLREMLSKQPKPGQAGKATPTPGQQQLTLDGFVRAARGQSGDKPGDQQAAEGGQAMQARPGQGDESDGMLVMPTEQGTPAPGAKEGLVSQGIRAGEGGKPESLVEPTERSGKHVDTRVRGQHGDGATRSEVILEAGQQGFATRSYERVHTEYQRHAEAILERDQIPGGYRFYVRRYFQLIRPREVQHE